MKIALPRLANVVLLLPAGLALAWIVVEVALFGARGGALGDFLGRAMFSTTGVASIAAALAAGVIATLLALAPGVMLAGRARGLGAIALVFWLGGLALPVVFLGGAYSYIFELGPAPPISAGGSLLRWAALSLVWGLAFTPPASLVIAAAVRAIPAAELRAAMVHLTPWRRWRAVILPRMGPGLLLAALVSAAFAMMDAATPPHFGVESTASLAQLEFQRSLETAPAATAMLAPWLVAAVAAAFILRNDPAPAGSSPARPGWVGGLTFAAAVLTVLLPGGWMLYRGVSHLTPALLGQLTGEIGNTLAYVAVAALVCAAVAELALAATAAKADPLARPARLNTFSALVLLLAPGFGLGLAGVAANARVPSGVWWWLAFLLRVAPWGLVAAVAIGNLNAARAATALGMPASRRIKGTLRDHGWRPAMLAALAGAAAALREVDLFSAFCPPGGESLAARSAQLLHYGMRPGLSALMTVQMACALVLGALLVVLSNVRRGGNG
ncbi:MAG: hypothetical protein IT462_14030 [Planctomycetes bacterium]|nr:hypothetical protein [Planctomycetota bacterium]